MEVEGKEHFIVFIFAACCVRVLGSDCLRFFFQVYSAPIFICFAKTNHTNQWAFELTLKSPAHHPPPTRQPPHACSMRLSVSLIIVLEQHLSGTIVLMLSDGFPAGHKLCAGSALPVLKALTEH